MLIDTFYIHPMIVHFPIALIIVGFVVEVVALFSENRKEFLFEGALYLLVIGTVLAIPAVLTGLYGTEELTGAPGNLRDLHETWAFISVTAGVITMLAATYTRMHNLQNSKYEWLVAILYMLTTASIAVTGYLGGVLTHQYL